MQQVTSTQSDSTQVSLIVSKVKDFGGVPRTSTGQVLSEFSHDRQSFIDVQKRTVDACVMNLHMHKVLEAQLAS